MNGLDERCAMEKEMKPELYRKIEAVRSALHEAGKGMEPDDWKALLEELAADIDGHLDALREERLNEET